MPTPSSILTGLDDEQRAAVLALEGPVAILAGAGTGKTRAITHRIAYGVATEAHEARRTLAVTFTTRAAGEMRSRLRDLGAEQVAVRTFHAAALRQLRYFWPRLSGQQFPELMASKARLVAESAAAVGLATDTAFVRDLSSDIEYAKSTELTPRDLGTATSKREWSTSTADVARAMAEYEDRKAARGVLDFEDVLLVMVGALQSRPDIADEVHAAYRWFTVDEFQDVNPLQRRLLDLWRGERDDVCVVGDVSQTIYSFTGASADYLLRFGIDFPGATEVRLVTSYRSTAPIVDLANSVIAQAPTNASIRLRSRIELGPKPSIDVYDDDVDEANGVAAHIDGLLATGVRARDIAVLFRINAQSAALEEALDARHIATAVRGVERFFDRPEVREGITRLRGAARGGQATGDLASEVRAVLGAAGWSEQAPRGGGAVRERWESLCALVSLADEHPDLTLSEFVGELDRRADAQHAPTAEAVTLSSLHAAKGLEWEHVFIVGCSEGLLPLQRGESNDNVDEERRLLYVGITRARTGLRLSWARSRQPGGRATRAASRFLTAADPSVLTGAAASVQAGTRKTRTDRRRTGPARCRVCDKALVTGTERTLGRCRTCEVDVDIELVDRLKAWRLEQAHERNVPAYVIFTDATLMAIAERRPDGLEALADIPGIGPAKLDAYGITLLSLIDAV